MLTNSDIAELTALRRALHQRPEVSGEEAETAASIAAAARALQGAEVFTGLGGHGVAVVLDSGQPGPGVMFRAELDALPIEELNDVPWRSTVPGKGHLCGHDGHMVMLLALGRLIARNPVARGRVILMFQPAEEVGSGARAVVSDPGFDAVRPDWGFAIHMMPGLPRGHVAIAPGLVNCASQGLHVTLAGKTAHASTPEDGLSPAPAVAAIIPALAGLESGTGLRLATLTHVQIGAPTFGIAPGQAVLHVTLRTDADAAMADLADSARALITGIASDHGLGAEYEIRDDFAASVNDPAAAAQVVTALEALNIPHDTRGLPMRGSEDFGVFGWDAKTAMLYLGPGEDYAALHNPDYDFPDDLIPTGAAIFHRIARDLLG